MVFLVYSKPRHEVWINRGEWMFCPMAAWAHTQISELAADFAVASCSKSWLQQSLASTVCALQEAWGSSGMSNTRSFIFG